jgi:hypothetical protein
MFILEVIHVNKEKDLFFEDTETGSSLKEQFAAFYKSFDETHSKKFYKENVITTSNREQLQDGSFKRTTTKSFFKKQSDAELYFKELFLNYQQHEWDESGKHKKHTEDFILQRIEWLTSNNIFMEANILDNRGKFIKCINSCTQQVCIRFGECNPSEKCATIYPESQIFNKSKISLHHIPISSIKRKV